MTDVGVLEFNPMLPSIPSLLVDDLSGLASWHPLTLLFLLYVTNSINQFHTYETSTSPRISTRPGLLPH